MDLLIALVNWSSIPLTVKDSPQSQIAGMGIGASVTALIIYLFTRPAFDAATWAVAFIAGMLWTIGQMWQFISYTRIGVSGTIPLSAGFQLVGNSLIGVLIFGEWPTAQAKVIGLWIYSSFPKLIAKDINPGVNGFDYIFPEMLGVLVGTVIYVIGTLFYLFFVKQNGVTNAFIYSQLCSVISTFGDIWFLHEEKSKRQMTYIIGLIFIVGAVF